MQDVEVIDDLVEKQTSLTEFIKIFNNSIDFSSVYGFTLKKDQNLNTLQLKMDAIPEDELIRLKAEFTSLKLNATTVRLKVAKKLPEILKSDEVVRTKDLSDEYDKTDVSAAKVVERTINLFSLSRFQSLLETAEKGCLESNHYRLVSTYYKVLVGMEAIVDFFLRILEHKQKLEILTD